MSQFTFENVWQRELPEVTEEVTNLWMSARAFQQIDKAEERATQLVYVVRNSEGKIVAVSTGFKAYIKKLKNHFYALRLFVHPDHRIPGLDSKLLLMTRDHFQSIYQAESDQPCKGVVTIVENERIKQVRREAVWRTSKMAFIGKTEKGHHIRVYYFPGVKI